ncbi:hypothetical protein Hamer_G015850 [Homarus americanus]|uniref:Uncharacterized protein n=1 Tax=Homarus americanus TaxID=6706 RepID=A0A8J5MMT7_HOMAM|nr:hypothetical protein Hamer_G015850 [Homarus americanus]
MWKFTDERGGIRLLVCCAVLLLHYALRDAVITALSTIAADPAPSDNTTTTFLPNDTTYFTTESVLTSLKSEPTVLSPVSTSSTDSTSKTPTATESTFTSASPSSSVSTPNTFHSHETTDFVFRKTQSNDQVHQEIRERFRFNKETFFRNMFKFVRPSVLGRSRTSDTSSDDVDDDYEYSELQESDSSVYLVSGSDNEKTTDDLPHLKEGWSLVIQGVVLSSVNWTSLLTTHFADALIRKVGVGVVLAGSMGVASFIGLLTHAASMGGPWLLLFSRLVLGITQGLSLPSVLRVVDAIPDVYEVVFVPVGGDLGTLLGTGLAGLKPWYLTTYLTGSLALLVTVLCIMLPHTSVTKHYKGAPWKEVVKNRSVWILSGIHVGSMWVLQTLVVAVSYRFTYIFTDPSAGGWWAMGAPLLGLLVAGFYTTLTSLCEDVEWLNLCLEGDDIDDQVDATCYALIARTCLRFLKNIKVVIGGVIVTVAAILMAVGGMNTKNGLIKAAVSMGCGLYLMQYGNKHTLKSLAPWEEWHLVKVFKEAEVVTAALTPLLVTGIAQSGEGGWAAVWVIPLVVVLPSAVGHLCLPTTIDLPWVEPINIPDGAEEGISCPTWKFPRRNNNTVNRPNTPTVPPREVRQSIRSGQSFFSARSDYSFKTAVSLSRSRTTSARTVDDSLEGDMQSAVECASVDFHSVIDEADPECVSVASTNTFKSDGPSKQRGDSLRQQHQHRDQQFGSMLSNGTDRTAAWLSSHHNINNGPSDNEQAITKI